MNRTGITRLVARREITERLQGRLIRIMTLVTVLVVVGAITVPGLIKGSSTPTRVGLVGTEAQALASAVERTAIAAKARMTLSNVPTETAAREQVTSGQLDAALSVGPSTARVDVKHSLDPTIRAVLQASVDSAHLRQSLAQSGIPVDKVLPALTPVPLQAVALKPPPPDQTARAVAAIAAALLMYVSLALYGTAVANGVAQEKTSRTAEVLLAAVRPSQLLSGKVLGIGLTGLGQLAIAAGAGVIANALVHSTRIPGSVWVLLPAFLACFLAGFTLYAFAYAAAGALVSRQEEVQFVTLPMGLFLLVGYLLVYAVIAHPDATWVKMVSFLPPLMATLLPARIALGHVAPWEIPLDVVIMGLSIWGMIRIASRVYANALIYSGARLGWKQALRLTDQKPQVTESSRSAAA
ncbi:MAG TPA: ABC transporter permease [Solirubrobacteraceae bacterium]|nr:ABC transporter permease [Solirubrobacteraceae bacterium]